jgi:hypothetical protein
VSPFPLNFLVSELPETRRDKRKINLLNVRAGLNRITTCSQDGFREEINMRLFMVVNFAKSAADEGFESGFCKIILRVLSKPFFVERGFEVFERQGKVKNFNI